ncbi:BolA domain-containing protein [Purpureocillium lavendulum]|uniref:BolA domain-containing protein n=1 Tax=Purpureocillium lavendulum TaxID=1247861 RepID=A0AB34FPJ5_9HYPO|nr:BolA domain-containing protein [Purpureocillium lavendulum]
MGFKVCRVEHPSSDPASGPETASRGWNPWSGNRPQSPAPPYSESGPTPPPQLPPRNSYQAPAPVRPHIERLFHENCEGKPYLTAIEAAPLFLQSGLAKSSLSDIWEQVDLDRDGRLNIDEFAQAMWLIELRTGGTGGYLQTTPAQPPDMAASSNQPHSRPSSYHSAISPYPSPPSSSHPVAIPPPYQRAPYQSYPSSQPYSAPPLQPQQWQQANPAIPPPPPDLMTMSKAMICAGCEAGILPDDVIYHCAKCDKKNDGLSYCERCYAAGQGRDCQHGGSKRVKLTEGDLPIRDKDGSWGLGVKCIKCKTKMRKKDLCFKCSHCWDPDFCPNCWRSKDKRCKHAAKGKVKMCRVGRKEDDDIWNIIDDVTEVLVG